MSSLYQVQCASRYKVTEMPTIPLLHTLGVYQGAIVEKVATYSLGGPVLLMIDSREVAVRKKFAREILVEEVKGS